MRPGEKTKVRKECSVLPVEVQIHRDLLVAGTVARNHVAGEKAIPDPSELTHQGLYLEFLRRC